MAQYCRICRQWKSESEFHDEKRGYHGQRQWCKDCTREYNQKRNSNQRKVLRKLVRFWNKHHPKNQIPMPPPYKKRK